MRTPYFIIREADLLKNLGRIRQFKELSGAKILLALKCFSTWGVFDIMKPYLDGTTSSSPFEARLGCEKFGGETHAFSVGYAPEDVAEVVAFADKIIFNSLSQLAASRSMVPAGMAMGIRLNPEVSYAKQDKTDPARAYSRLGVRKADLTEFDMEGVSGAMFHMNCENADFPAFQAIVEAISQNFGPYLDRMDWVSLGGGIAYTSDGYPLEACAALLRDFAKKHGVQVYLEPGEAVITRSADMVVTVLDIAQNEKWTAIVDSATEAHRLDTLIFNEPPKIREATEDGPHEYFIGSCSCLAGDVFCQARFEHPLRVGDRLHILDSAGYTMVKLNWFNGLRMPSVYCQRVDGRLELLNEFSYQDYVAAMCRKSVSLAAAV